MAEFDDQVLSKINEIYTDVKTLAITTVPQINEHLVVLNGSVASNRRDIEDLRQWREKIPCIQRGNEIMALQAGHEDLREKTEKHTANWGQVMQIVLSILQTLILARLIVN